MNRSLRLWATILLLGGLLVLLGGSASNSGAAPCNTFNFKIALPSSPDPFYVDRSTSTSFTPTITALACGDPLTSYKGPASLTASGTSTDGAFASTLAAGITDPGLTFKQGVATPKLTATTAAVGVTLTVTDGTGKLAAGTVGPFDVYDKTKSCSSSDPCNDLSIQNKEKGPDITVTVNLPSVASGVTGLSLGALHATVKCGDSDAEPAMGAPYTIAPPSGVGSGLYTATVRYSKKEAPGTGVANFVHCFSGAPESGVLTFEQVLPCNKSGPGEKCILDQRRNNAGDLIVTFQLGGSNDPGGTGFK